MKNGLYRAEVYSSFLESKTAGTTNMPEAYECAMITNKSGMFFAKLHPVKIAATPRRGCVYCNEMRVKEVVPYNAEGRMHMRPVKYCFNCGKYLKTEEAAK